jgi:hypothetical protein
LSEAVVESAQRQANERFLWVAGEWRFAIDLSQEAISFPWNATWKTEERKFTLSEQDVAALRKVIELYHSGVGLCRNWRLIGLLDAKPLIEVKLMP